MDSQRLVFFDLETGGLDPKRHPIIQLGAIAVSVDLEPLEAFEAKLRFDPKRANRNSLRKNHYHAGIWAKEAIVPFEAARLFADFLRRHATAPMVAADGRSYKLAQLVAHNAGFDGEFLQAWYAKLSVYLPAKRHVLCTMQRAIWFFTEETAQKPPKDFKLATLCQRFGVPFPAASAHEALSDVTATLAFYRRLLNSATAPPFARAG